MFANNNMKLSFSINNILHETKNNQNEVLELSDQRLGKRKVLISKIGEDQTDSKYKKSVKLKEPDFENNRDEIFSQNTAEIKNSKSEENDDNYLDDENDEEYEIDEENLDEKREHVNNIVESQKLISSDISAKYKHLNDYYLNYCYNRLILNSKPDFSVPQHFLQQKMQQVDSGVDNNSDQQAELSKNILRLYLTSTSTNNQVASEISPSSIYSNFLIKLLENINANPITLSGSGSPYNSLTHGQLCAHQKLSTHTFEMNQSQSLIENIQKDSRILEHKEQNYQKRIGHPYQNRNPPKRKKPRTSFNRPQIVELEKRFIKQKYLASSERSSLAKLLQMTDAQVKTWFQNRRTKWRRQNAEEKQAERQATNKLLMTLKQQQHNQTKSILNITTTNCNTKNPNRLDLSNFGSISSTVSSIENLETSGETEKSIANNQEVNPLNKLIMMEKVFSAATATQNSNNEPISEKKISH